MQQKKKKGKSYRKFSNECKRKTKQRRRRSNDEHSSPSDSKIQQEKGTRIGGSTTHLLPEPRANQVQGIERFDDPLPDTGDY